MTDKLLTFPKLGRVVPEFQNVNIREIIYRNYRIIYELEEERIVILSVLHGSKLIDEDKDQN